MNIQGWFPSGFTGLISFAVQVAPKSLFQHRSSSINSLVLSLLYGPPLTSIHDYWKAIALIRQPFVCKLMSLLFTTLSRFFVAFLPRSNQLWISLLQSPSAVILEPPKINSITGSFLYPSVCYAVMDQMQITTLKEYIKEEGGMIWEKKIKSVTVFIVSPSICHEVMGPATPRPRSRDWAGKGGPRGATPHSRSGGAAVRRYPTSKVRETRVKR